MNIKCSLGQKCLYGFQKLFIRRETKPWKGGFSISINSAIKAGLTFRRLEDTVMDVYVWMKSIEEWELKAGISGEREKELLEKWYP